MQHWRGFFGTGERTVRVRGRGVTVPSTPGAAGAAGGSAPPKRARGGQPGNSNRVTHGAYRKRTALKSIDWTTQLDRRTALYRELRERAERIVDGAGGPGAIGPNRLALAPHAAQVELELEVLNEAIRRQGPIDRRRNRARAIVEDRNRLLRTYRELLTEIGLEREPAERGETLSDLIASYEREAMGTPRLEQRGGSTPRKSRRDSGNPSPGGEGHPPEPPYPPHDAQRDRDESDQAPPPEEPEP